MPKDKRAAPAAPPEFKDFERGLQALQAKDYAAAISAFDKFIEGHPEHPSALDRARAYRNAALRWRDHKPLKAKDAKDHLLLGVIGVNRGDYKAAAEHFGKALELEPKSDLAHFMLATAAAEQGQAEEAIQHLRAAIKLEPLNRAFAANLPEFDGLRDEPELQELLADQGDGHGRRK
jgi:Tfp pilus assembly protein PilF